MLHHDYILPSRCVFFMRSESFLYFLNIIAVGTFLFRAQIKFARDPLISVCKYPEIIEWFLFLNFIMKLSKSKELNWLAEFQPSGLFFKWTFSLHSDRTISGTALQERARAISSKDETMRGLIIQLSPETSESLENIYERRYLSQKRPWPTQKLSPSTAYARRKSPLLPLWSWR